MAALTIRFVYMNIIPLPKSHLKALIQLNIKKHDVRPQCQCVVVDFKNNRLWATDGYAACIIKQDFPEDTKQYKTITMNVSAVSQAIKDTNKSRTQTLALDYGHRTLAGTPFTSLESGAIPNIDRIIPTQSRAEYYAGVKQQLADGHLYHALNGKHVSIWLKTQELLGLEPIFMPEFIPVVKPNVKESTRPPCERSYVFRHNHVLFVILSLKADYPKNPNLFLKGF